MSHPVSGETILKQLNWRYATKAFDPARKVPAEDWKVLEQTLLLSPSSFGLQPCKFVVVTDPKVKEQLPAISWGQTQPRDCSHFVVFAARKELADADVDRFIAETARQRGMPVEALKGYRDIIAGSVQGATGHHLAWNSRQAYIALGFLLTQAAMLGIDACPMEGIETAKYDNLLGLDREGYVTLCAAAIGYRSPDDKYAGAKKVRYAASDVIRHV